MFCLSIHGKYQVMLVLGDSSISLTQYQGGGYYVVYLFCLTGATQTNVNN